MWGAQNVVPAHQMGKPRHPEVQNLPNGPTAEVSTISGSSALPIPQTSLWIRQVLYCGRYHTYDLVCSRPRQKGAKWSVFQPTRGSQFTGGEKQYTRKQVNRKYVREPNGKQSSGIRAKGLAGGRNGWSGGRRPFWAHLWMIMATHSSTLAWRFPWTEEPGGLQSMGSPRARPNWVTKFNFLDDRKGQVLQGPGKKGFSAARTGRAKCLRLGCAGGVVRWPALRMPAGQVECDLGRRARQGPGLIALRSHREMGRLQT